MTFAIISDLRGMTEAQFAAVRGMLDAARQSGPPAQIAEPAADSWRILGNWTFPAVMGAFGQAAAPFGVDAIDGGPTWEDAEWQ